MAENADRANKGGFLLGKAKLKSEEAVPNFCTQGNKKMNETTMSQTLSGFDDDSLVSALAAEDWHHPSGATGHLAREYLYDELARRCVKTHRARLIVFFGLYRESRDSHALSACISCIQIIFDLPSDAINHVLTSNVNELSGLSNQVDRLKHYQPVISHCVSVLAASQEEK